MHYHQQKRENPHSATPLSLSPVSLHYHNLLRPEAKEGDPTACFVCHRTRDPMKQERDKAGNETSIAVDHHHHCMREGAGVGDDDLLGEIHGGLIFADDAFPSLPDFPCLSSPSRSSSSSSTTARSSSTASSTSWSVAKAPPSQGGHPRPKYEGPAAVPQADQDHDRKRDGVLLADLQDPLDEEFWDPSTLFPAHSSVPLPDQLEHLQAPLQEQQHQDLSRFLGVDDGCSGGGGNGSTGSGYSADLAMVFFEWLKTNKEAISPEDLKTIKLKRSTIESAARRLGGGKEGMKQLLKLILAWVQNYHLQNRRHLGGGGAYHYQQFQPPAIHVPSPCAMQEQNPNPNPSPIYSPMALSDGYSPCSSSWIPSPDTAIGGGGSGGVFPFSSAGGEAAMAAGVESLNVAEPLSAWGPPVQYSMVLADAQFPGYLGTPGQFSPPSPAAHYVGGGYGAQYPTSMQLLRAGQSEQLVRMASSSATKEARKKRMARQRRFMSMHHHRQQQQQHKQQPSPPQQQQQKDHDWGVWSMASPGTSSGQLIPPAEAMQVVTALQQQQKEAHVINARGNNNGNGSADRRQGLKAEKNLRFLLQKVLKQSDVGSLGRIVLPKKEAEVHLPELEARDGISIAMEDIGTSRTWNMRYRYWPNNKSRMYLLENTGDFVRSNGLQEGDFIVIYSDVKCGKYMIRGVKVRKPVDAKAGKQPLSHVNRRSSCSNGGDTDDDDNLSEFAEQEVGEASSMGVMT